MTTTRTAPSTTWSGRAMLALRATYTVLLLATGIDKFFDWMTDWEALVAPWVTGVLPLSAGDVMLAAGIVEILIGLLVATRPRLGGFAAAVWLLGTALNLATFSPPAFFATALRDLALAAGAFALGASVLGWRRSGGA